MFRIVRFVMFFLVFGGFTAGIHVFLYRRLVRDVIAHQRWRRIARWAFAIFVIGGLLVRPLSELVAPQLARYPSLVFVSWLGFAIYAGMWLLAIEAIRTVQRLARPAPVAVNEERRQFVSRAIAGSAAAFAGGTFGLGVYRAYSPAEVTEVPVKLPGLPRALDGFTLVQLSDVHIGPVLQRRFLEDLIARASAQRPDALVITGDLVDASVERIGGIVSAVQNARSRYGTFFITGNHDYYSGADEWCDALRGMGVNVLRNQHVKLGDASASFDLIGVDDWNARRERGSTGYDLAAAIAGRDRSRASVLLAHQPTNLEEVERAGIGLQLSGHTHGGQLFPATEIAQAIWGPRNAGYSRVGNTQVYVSRGCGFVGPPMRLGSPPEIVKIILSPA